MMLVKDAKQVVRNWVESEVSKIDGYSGAFIFGSVNWMKDDDEFPSSSDVDVRIVLDLDELPISFKKEKYNDVLIDVSYVSLATIQSPEDVLSNYPMAPHFTQDCIIADPHEYLERVRDVVSKEYPRRKWVEKRVNAVKQWQLDSIEQFLNKAAPLHDQVFAWLYGSGMFSHIFLVADLKNPTVRKAHAASGDVLKHYGKQAFHEKTLNLIGSADMTMNQVQALLDNCAEAFDSAKEVRKTEFFGDTIITDMGRPTAIGGIQELIDKGYHREAVYWLIVIHTWCQKILYNDAPPDIQAEFMPKYDAFMQAIGIQSTDDIDKKIEQIKELTDEAYSIADYIMKQNTDIIE